MVVNFRTREISRGTRKLIRTPMLLKKNDAIPKKEKNLDDEKEKC
jgi:hypothetical protein